MSSNYCGSPICQELTCPGCKDGQVWCQDPKCAPNCADCAINETHDFAVNMTVIIILICLVAILFIVWFVYGPSFFVPHNNYEHANVVVPTEYYT